VDERNLVRISVACSITGLLLIYGFSLLVEPKGVSINLLERNQGRIVRITGTVVDLRRHEAGHIFLKLKDESGTCEVPLFRDLAKRVPPIFIGDRLQVIGTAEEYRDSEQVVPRNQRDVVILPTPPTSISSAKSMVGETTKIRGIAYDVRELEKGEEFYLTDGEESLVVTFPRHGVARTGYNLTLSGTVKVRRDETYFAARQVLDVSAAGAENRTISETDGADGIFLIKGRLRLRKGGPKVDDGTGTLDLEEDLLRGRMVDGDIIELIVRKRGDELKVLEVELDKESVLPVENINEEMVGNTVRVRGTVIDKFVSGRNIFLTLHNGTDLDVPLFGAGKDVNIQLGDVITVSGRVGVYRERLQVVPKNASEISVDAPEIVDKDLDKITTADLYTLVRTRGRISSIKRYAKSSSFWMRGERGKIRVYLTFTPEENLSVGTDMEVIGLVKTYVDSLELVPRGREDLG